MSFLNRFLPDKPQDDTLHSVVRNLHHLFNSRRGYSSRLRDFGLADYLAEQGGKNTAMAVMREMRDDIENFEPRLQLIDLKTTGRDAQLRLHIWLRGRVRHGERSAPCYLLLLFETTTGAVEILVADAA